MKKIHYVFLLCLFFSSCSTKKNIVYLQNLNFNENLEFKYSQYKLKVDDILKIDFSSESPEAVQIFNSVSLTANTISNTKDNLIFNGYKIDSDGFISVPSIGSVKAVGMTISELKHILYGEIINKGLMTSIHIDVKLLNQHFTVLGEVNNPGRHEFLKNNLNIIEAIGIAGDLTINGKRNDIKLLREKNGVLHVSSYDLTSNKIFESDYFQIFSGDIIIVNPNTNRVKNAGIIGNSGTLVSLLSFLLSSIIIISNN